MINEGRVIFDLRQAADDLCELRKIVLSHAAGTRVGQTFPNTRASLFVLDRGDQVFHVDVRVPDIQDVHLAELCQSLSVGSDACGCCVPGKTVAEAVVSAGENEAGGQALYIPFPGGGERLIQIIDVENDPSLRRGKCAEVEKMTIAASLNA